MTLPMSAADLRDQHWLDQQVAVLGDGIEAAKEIWLNWSDIRCVGRLHLGMTAGDFLASQLGGLRLDVGDLVKALPDMSTREIAKVAGVSHETVAVEKRAVRNLTPDADPTRVVGADGKSYPGRVIREVTAEVIEPKEISAGPRFSAEIVVSALSGWLTSDPAQVAASVPKSYLPSTRASLKRVHAWMGALIAELDRR